MLKPLLIVPYLRSQVFYDVRRRIRGKHARLRGAVAVLRPQVPLQADHLGPRRNGTLPRLQGQPKAHQLLRVVVGCAPERRLPEAAESADEGEAAARQVSPRAAQAGKILSVILRLHYRVAHLQSDNRLGCL